MRNGLNRWLALAALSAVLVVALASSVGSRFDTPAEARLGPIAASGLLASNAPVARIDGGGPALTSGEDAIAQLGSRLPLAARGYGWTAAELAEAFRSDSTLHIDSTDKLFYIEPPIDSSAATESAFAAAAAPEAAAPFPLTDTFKLHSLPGAKLTILLDFGGRTMSGNGWTASFNAGADIVSPAWSMDGTASPDFNDTERAAIQDVWRRVAEDYAPFNVDVTTEFTSEAAITRTDISDLNYGTRVLVSPISNYFGPYGGLAYVGVYSMTSDYYKPALVFPENLSNGSRYIAEAAAHEAGHNLGLRHDGTTTPSADYYAGSGTGETGWAPIMGVGYYRNLTQWSKGEYPSASRTEDDLAILQGYLAYRPDDVGDTTATAGALRAGSALAASGIIASSVDSDVYSFAAGTGTTSLVISPAALGPNLDVYAEIRRADGSVVASSNPAMLLSASLSIALPAGTYYLAVRGTGKLTPLDDGGYSSYGSIGQYTVTGTVPFAAPVTIATPSPVNAFGTWVSSDVIISLAATEPVYGVASTHYSINGASAVTYSGAPVVISTPGTSTFAYSSRNNSGDAEATKTATVRIDKVKPTTTAPGLLGGYPAGGGGTVVLSPSDALSGVTSTLWRIGTSGGYTTGTTVTVPSVAGSYTLQYYSTDAAGNIGAVQSATLWVFDLTPPITTAAVTPAAAIDGWASSNATITLSATDAVPGVAWTRYSINGAAERTYLTPIVVSSSGNTTIAYRSQDSSNNAEATKTVTVHVDNTSPLTTALDLASGYVKNSGASITLTATDVHAGVLATQWRLGTGGAFTTGVTVPVPAGVGTYTLQYFSQDKVGNAEGVHSATIVVTPALVTRVAGRDRYDTAVQLARKGWDSGNKLAWTGVKHVLIANGEPGKEADPIGAAALAGAYDAPVLLTQASRVPGSTRAALAEIAKANPGVRVHLIGGTSVVPDARWNDIKAIKGVSQIKDRVYGATRYSTSAAIAKVVVALMGKPQVQGVLVVAVDNPGAFYDALAASPIAYARTMPMVGVKRSRLEPNAMGVLGNELAGKPIYFVNSDAFVTPGMKVAIAGSPSPTSLATSSDHYTAATQIAQSAVSRGWMSRADTGLAAKLPDALTGGTFIGLRGGILLFTNSSGAINPVTKSYLTAYKAETTNGWVIGGTAVVPTAQETSFLNLLQ